MSADDRRQDIVSYRTLRRVVGLLGVALPVVLALWGFALCRCFQLAPSISDYYGLRTRDVLVGTLFTIAWFLFTYRGYERKDDVAGNLACVFALCVALFPNSGTSWERAVHFGAALERSSGCCRTSRCSCLRNRRAFRRRRKEFVTASTERVVSRFWYASC